VYPFNFNRLNVSKGLNSIEPPILQSTQRDVNALLQKPKKKKKKNPRWFNSHSPPSTFPQYLSLDVDSTNILYAVFCTSKFTLIFKSVKHSFWKKRLVIELFQKTKFDERY